MKITFIPCGTSQLRPSFYPHLGMLYLASALREWTNLKPEIELLDMRTLEMTIPQVMTELKKRPPDIIGLGAKTCEAQVARALSKEIKKWNPDVLVVIGGAHSSTFPDSIMKDSGIDVAVIGEGEKTLVEIVEKFAAGEPLAGIDGTLTRVNGELVMGAVRPYIEDVDSIPFPAWDLMDIDLFSRVVIPGFFLARKRMMIVFSSRACPYECSYCHQIFGKKFRPRSAENVLQELEILYHKYGVQEFHFIDDVFNLQKERVHAICDGILERKMDVSIVFPNGLRADILDRDTVAKLRKAGTYCLYFGVESGSPRILKLINRKQNLDKIKQVVRWCDEEGMITGGFIMMGFPSETREELESTSRFILDNPFTRMGISQVTALPGTKLHKITQDIYPHIDLDKDSGRYFSDNSWFEQATGIKVTNYIKKTVLKFYLNPIRMWKLFWRVPQKRFLLRGFSQFIRLLAPSFITERLQR